MRKNLLLLLTISLWCLGFGSNELFAKSGYFKADPVLTSIDGKSNGFIFQANTTFAKYLKGIAVAPPSITNCDGLIQKDADGTCTANVAWNIPSSPDGFLAANYPQLASNPGVQVFPPHTFPVGRDTVVYLFSNADGDTYCRIPIHVRDITAPVISGGSCGATVNVNADAGVCFATNVPVTSPTVVDGCSAPEVLSYSFVDADGVTRSGTMAQSTAINTAFKFKLGSTTITWTGTDAAGNAATCITTVVVTDTEFPVLTAAPAGGTFNNDAGICGARKGFISPTATDNCSVTFSWTIYTESGATLGYQPLEDVTIEANGTGNVDNYLFTVGTHYIVYTAVDGSSNTVSDLTTVEVVDNEAPSLNGCASDVTFSFNTGNDGGYDCMAEVSLLKTPATDNCDASNLLTWTYELYDANDVQLFVDGAGNPVSGSNNVNVTLALGEYYVVYRVADSKANVSVPCTLNIKVVDDEAPKFTSPLLADQNLVNEGAGVCYNDTLLSSPNVTDNCAGVTLAWLVKQGSTTLASGNGTIPSFQFPVGLSTVIWIATDAAGHSISDTVLVTVTDVTAPTLNAGADIALTTAANSCSANVVQNITFSDNCGIASIVENSAIGNLSNVNLLAGTATFSGTFPVGATTTVTVTVTDVNGNITTDAFDVTITDVTNPTINNFANIVQPSSAGKCDFTRSFNIASDFLPMDNCGIASTVVDFELNGDNMFDDDQITFTGGTGTFSYTFNKGISAVRVTVTDNSGNTAMDEFTVTINDLEKPVVFFQDTVVVNIDPSSCTSALVNLELTDELVSDNCSSDAYLLANATNNQTAFGAVATGYYNLGYTNLSWMVMDESGNTATKDVVVWVRDVTLPSDSPNDTISILADLGLCSGKVKVFSPNSADSCGISSITYSINGAPEVTGTVINGFAFPVGTNIVRWFTTDNNSNTRIDTSVVIVTDAQAPVFTGSNFITVNAGNNCAKDTTITVGVTDNCSATPSVTWELIHFTDINDADGDTLSGTGTSVNFSFPASVNPSVLTFTGEDQYGNTSTKVVTVTINDTQAPSVTCPGNLTYSSDASICGAVLTLAGDNELIDAPITDNCGIASITGVYGLTNIPFDPTSATTFDVGTTSVTITITDNNGNSTTCTFNITVEDNQGPVASSFPSNIVTTTLANECAREVFWTEPVATDACTGNNFTMTSSHVNGQDFPIGTTTVTYTFTDQNGNVSTRSFNITVNDTQKPVINSLPGNTTLYLPANACTATLVFEANVQDNCGAQTLTTTATYPSGSQLAVGTYTNIFTVTDASGNSTTASFNVTVIDTIKPTFPVFPSNITSCNPVVTYNVQASDNCTVTASTNSGTVSGATFAKGTTTVTWTATDANGNSASRSFTVTVIDPTTPALAGSDMVTCFDGSTITLVGNTPLNGETVKWSTTSPAGIASPNSPSTNISVASAGVYTFKYEIIGNPACANTSDEIMVTVNNLPSVADAGADQFITGSSAVLTAVAPTIGMGTWTNATGAVIANATNFSTSVSNLQKGDNIFTWTVSSAGCATTYSDQVNVFVDGTSIVQSTAFTPNGDGENDTFEIPELAKSPKATIQIFNRWGGLVFESTGADYGKGWDGTYEGTEAPVASYYYVIDLNDGSPVYKGYVSIIR